MIWAIISRFGFFQISFFLIRELSRATPRINECARLYEIPLAHRVHAAFISTIRQNLDSFVRILNTRPAIGDALQLTAVVFHPRLRSAPAQKITARL
jgi:hypothetical protein